MTVSPWKLRPPTLPRPHLSRPRLVGRLSALQAACLAAPAGYGKSVLLVEALAAAPGRTAWYTLDPSDLEPERLAAGLAATLGAPSLNWPDLLDWWAGQNAPICLALDDVHHLSEDGQACTRLGALLAASPPGSRVLLAGRRPLLLPAFARLLAAGQAERFAAADLVFAADETAAVLGQFAAGLERRAAELHQTKQGWPAALLSLARERPGEPAALHEYLDGEITARMPDRVRNLAVKLSVLAVWDGAACARLAGPVPSGAEQADLRLDALRRPELPIETGQDGALHPHPLWLEQLQGRLRSDPVQYREAQRQAALLLAGRGEDEMALPHALAAGDAGLVEPLLRGLSERAIRTGDLDQLQEWLTATPTAMLEAMPDLLLATADAFVGSGSPRQAVAWLQRAVIGFAAAGRPGGLVRAVSRLASAFADLGEWTDARAAIQQLEADLPEARGAERGEILLAMARANAAAGLHGQAAQRFREAADILRQSGEHRLAGIALLGLGGQALAGVREWEAALATIRLAQSALPGAAAAEAGLAEGAVLLLLRRWQEAEQVLSAVHPVGGALRAQWHWLQAALAGQRGALADAAHHVLLGERAQTEADPTPALAAGGLLARARLFRDQGDVMAAQVYARQATQLAESAEQPLLAALAEEFAVREAVEADQPQLQAELLGAFRLRCGEREIPPDAWGRARSRALIQYLLLQPGYVAGRDMILEAFWPEQNPARSRGVLRVTLHQVRRVLEAAGVAIEATPDLIRLPPSVADVVDVAQFRGRLADARRAAATDPERCLEHCREGRALYRGDLLPEADWPWTATERSRLRRELVELLQLWQEAATALGRTEEAIAVLEDLLSQEPGLEQAERALMELLARTGRRSEALQRYRRFVRWLKAETGLDPSPETRVTAERVAGS